MHLFRRHFCRAAALSLGIALALPGAVQAQGSAPDTPMGVGPAPVLPAPQKNLVPIVNIAPAQGWDQGAAPRAMAGLRVTALARGWTTRAGCWCCPTEMCSWPRATSPTRRARETLSKSRAAMASRPGLRTKSGGR